MAANTELNERIESIEDEFSVGIVIKGGGRGWTAVATDENGKVVATAKAESKGLALSLVENDLTDNHVPAAEAEEPEEEPEESEEIECSDECQTSTNDYCQCKCNGDLHGSAVKGLADRKTVRIGEKACKCGCGETTKRLFVPGHDARYHARQSVITWALENGMGEATYEEASKAKKAAVRKAARDRRAARRAEAAAKAAAVVATITAKTPKSRKRQSDDDLPF